MKTIINVILLMAILCLAGCSSEDPQSVAFGVNELSFDEKTNTVQLDIIANCPWVITGTGNFVVSDKKEGNGNETITVTVWENDTYEDRMQTITLQSEDGSSTDRFTASQRADFGLSMERPDMIPAEGGEFHIDIRTNDDISSVEVPDWIAYTSSRALTGYTYTFTAEPNKTGGKRRGPVRLRGKKTTSYVNVDQDSYVPTGVVVKGLSSYMFDSLFDISLSTVPEYADLSKLSVCASDGCSAELNGSQLKIKADNYGKHEIYFTSQENCIYKEAFERMPKNIFIYPKQEAYIHKVGSLGWNYYSSEYKTSSSDSTIVRICESNKFEAVNYGTAVINVTHPQTGTTDQQQITVEPFTAYAHILWLSEITYGNYEVSFTVTLEAPKGSVLAGYFLLDANNFAIYAENIKEGSKKRSIDTPKFPYTYDRKKFKNVTESLKGYKFLVEMVVDGKVHQRFIDIDIKRVGR